MNMCQMALYYMAADKSLLEKMEEEVVGKPRDFEGLKNMKYLDAFINEVLRFYGPAQGLFQRIAL